MDAGGKLRHPRLLGLRPDKAARDVVEGEPVTATRVTITHPDKILFPEDGITKAELAAYYDAVAGVMLPHLRRRPITMERFPAGIGAKGFLQKDVVKGFPGGSPASKPPRRAARSTIRSPTIAARCSGWRTRTRSRCVWPSRVPRIGRPDICVFDLDPSRDEPEILRESALALRDLLLEQGVTSWVKTSGSKGFHIVTRLAGFDVCRVGVRRLGRGGAGSTKPKHLTQAFSKADRGGRILIDTGRNRQGRRSPRPTCVPGRALRSRRRARGPRSNRARCCRRLLHCGRWRVASRRPGGWADCCAREALSAEARASRIAGP